MTDRKWDKRPPGWIIDKRDQSFGLIEDDEDTIRLDEPIPYSIVEEQCDECDDPHSDDVGWTERPWGGFSQGMTLRMDSKSQNTERQDGVLELIGRMIGVMERSAAHVARIDRRVAKLVGDSDEVKSIWHYRREVQRRMGIITQLRRELKAARAVYSEWNDGVFAPDFDEAMREELARGEH